MINNVELDEDSETSTCALQVRRSAAELIQQTSPRLSGAPTMLFLAGVNVQTCIVSRIHNWPRLGSNQRHTLLGLLYRLSYRTMAEDIGLEPITLRLTAACSTIEVIFHT